MRIFYSLVIQISLATIDLIKDDHRTLLATDLNVVSKQSVSILLPYLHGLSSTGLCFQNGKLVRVAELVQDDCCRETCERLRKKRADVLSYLKPTPSVLNRELSFHCLKLELKINP